MHRAKTARTKSDRTKDLGKKQRLLQESEDYLRKVIAQQPREYRAYVLLGTLLKNRGRFAEAKQLLEDGSTVAQGQNSQIWCVLGSVQDITGDQNSAKQCYDAAIYADKLNVASYHQLGRLYLKQGYIQKAKETYLQGLQETREYPNINTCYLYTELGNMAKELGKLNEARSWFEQCLGTQKGRTSDSIYCSYGMLEESMGNFDAAAELYEQCLKINKRARYIYLQYANLEWKVRNNVNRAREIFTKGHMHNPWDLPLLNFWASFERDQNRFVKAEKLYDLILQKNAKHANAWLDKGVMRLKMGKQQEAIQYFEQGIERCRQDPKVVKIYQVWANLELTKNKNVDKARYLYQCAVKSDSKNDSTWLRWAQMEQDQGNDLRAKELKGFRQENKQYIDLPEDFTTLS